MTPPSFSKTASPASPAEATQTPAISVDAPPARPTRINPWRLFTGAMVPNWLLCRVEISQGAKLCWARLAQFAGKDGECYPKQETLAAELGVSERQARSYVRELEEFALLEATQHGLGTSNSYAFLDHAWIHEGQPSAPAADPPDRQSASGQDRKNASGQDRQFASVPTREEIQNTEKFTHTRALGLPRDEDEAVQVARLLAIPDDFARTEFNRLDAVGFIDGCQRPVRKWASYLKQRWASEQSARAERSARAAARATRPAACASQNVNPSVAAVAANQRRREIQEELRRLAEEIASLRGTGDEHALIAREQELQRELAMLP